MKSTKEPREKKPRVWRAWVNPQHFGYARFELFRTKKQAIFSNEDKVIYVTITERMAMKPREVKGKRLCRFILKKCQHDKTYRKCKEWHWDSASYCRWGKVKP